MPLRRCLHGKGEHRLVKSRACTPRLPGTSIPVPRPRWISACPASTACRAVNTPPNRESAAAPDRWKKHCTVRQDPRRNLILGARSWVTLRGQDTGDLGLELGDWQSHERWNWCRCTMNIRGLYPVRWRGFMSTARKRYTVQGIEKRPILRPRIWPGPDVLISSSSYA